MATHVSVSIQPDNWLCRAGRLLSICDRFYQVTVQMDECSPGSSPRMDTRGLVLLIVIFLSTGQIVHFVHGQDISINATQDEEKMLIPSQLTVTSWNDMPFSGIVRENGKWIGKGYAFYILDLISSKLNFTYTIVPPDKHILGNEKTGILSLLYAKKVDIAVAFLPVLPEMQRYCTFSTALDETRLTALMKRPQESASGSGLMAPFDRTVWLLVLASLIFVGPVIYIFAHIRSKLWRDPESENYSMPSCFWFVYSSLLKQGTNIIATTDSTRMLFATWWIFILILTSFYTANLTAFLTKPQFTLSISSLQDIVCKGYSWITYQGRAIDFLLSQHTPNELSSLNTSIQRGKGVFKYNPQSKAILESVSTKKLFLAEAHFLQSLIFRDYVNKSHAQLEHSLRCTYVVMPGNILIANRAFAFPHGSAMEDSINNVLLRLVETGIIQHTKEKDVPLAKICPVDLRSTERQLRNTDLLLTYKVVVTGYGIAAAVFVLEIILAITITRMKRSRKDQKNNCLTCCNLKMRKSQNISTIRSMPAMDSSFYMQDFLSLEKNATLVSKNSTIIHNNNENDSGQGRKHYINGRSYYIVVDSDGDQRLIPIRTPSAFLFQYAT